MFKRLIALAAASTALTLATSFYARVPTVQTVTELGDYVAPEFQTLQKQRVRATLQGRDDLREAFGDSTFSRFDKFLEEEMNLKIQKATPSPQNN